jgi:predicted ATPase/DNA-binding winged helix-turn-helix (wHTH) protein
VTLPKHAIASPGAPEVEPPRHVIRFDGFEVRPRERQVLVEGAAVALGSRAFDLLLVLIECNGGVATKGEMLEAVWPGLVVEESNLSVQVASLRKVLGPDVIATIPGRGYRLTARPIDAPPSVSPRGAPAVALRTNLPPELPPLIGRDDDIAALGTLLAEHRLITITGPGGMGKTRLAERMLHDRRHGTEHGVAWVELAALTDPELLSGTIAAALGLQTAGGDPVQGLVVALSPLQMLVALDNAEHLIDDVARIVQALLDGAPQLRLLVTSQVPLRLAGERVYRLGALAVPDADEGGDDVLSYGAVRLFVERARAADRLFRVDEQSLPGILRICAQLDGVALAIELAAARVPMLGVAGVLALLDRQLDLLTQGRRDAPARQRTLRAALEWSHGLLSPIEATVFRRLGAFVGGFTLEAARRVASDPDVTSIDEWSVVDSLGALVDRSLVAVDTSDWPRYRLLESARMFALEQLAASGEERAVRQRHARTTLQRFVAVTGDSLDGRCGVDDALALLDPDLDNARASLAWFLTEDDALGAVSLAPAVSFALTIARHAERSQLWETTAPLMSDTLAPDVRARWAAACSGHWYWRKPVLAIEWAQLAIGLYRELGDDSGVYRALSMLGMATARADMPTDCERACAELRRFDERQFSARLQFMGNAAYLGLADRRGDVAEMQQILRRQLVLAEAAGDTGNVHNVLSTLADTELAAGHVDDAVRHGTELEQRLRGTRHQSSLAYARVGLTGALLAQGALDAARTMACMAWPLAVQFDIKFPLADNLALLSAVEGRAASAAVLIGYADAGYAGYGLVRQLTEKRAAEQAVEIARVRLGIEQFERLRAEGAGLHDDIVLRLALEENPRVPGGSNRFR